MHVSPQGCVCPVELAVIDNVVLPGVKLDRQQFAKIQQLGAVRGMLHDNVVPIDAAPHSTTLYGASYRSLSSQGIGGSHLAAAAGSAASSSPNYDL